MEEKRFYFIKDSFYELVCDNQLMENKEPINGVSVGRPCFFAFKEKPDSEVCWMIPISSKVEKFHKIVNHKIEKYGKCDTILFGNVLGHERAFLIQNMFPITDKYIDGLYLKSGVAVQIENSFAIVLVSKAKRILKLQRNGSKLIFPNIESIYDLLINK